LLAFDASAVSCRNFAREAQAAFAKEVNQLRQYEREAADRLKGFDSRPFRFMRDEAIKATAIIADADKLKDEESLENCRNATKPIRKICVGSAQLLVAILDKHVATATPDYDKPQYAAAMAECETLLGLKPLATRIRGNE
jgi:ABC-type transporter Mla subunit MlaD